MLTLIHAAFNHLAYQVGGMTCLDYAYLNGKADVVKFLLDAGARFTAKAAYDAAASGDLQLLQGLARGGWNLNTTALVRVLFFMNCILIL